MILLNNVLLPLNTDFKNLKKVAADTLKTDISNIETATLHRKSVDARRGRVCFCCSIAVAVKREQIKLIKKCKNASEFKETKYVFKKAEKQGKNRPIVVGFGPAGMFAALALARAGLKPLVIERGQDVDTRTRQVNEFLSGGKLEVDSNVQFGEGGAGTFSDGKLNTGIKNVRAKTVLEIFALHGAPKNILTDAKPHIGTDILCDVVKNIRTEIISLGGEVIFGTKLEDIKFCGGKICSVIANGKEIPCENLILATGHSARDTFEMLKINGIEMVKKPFSMGVRIEHLQSDINKALYGEYAQSEYLGAADYKMAVHLENGRGVYTFCMCPGGEVINSSSEHGGIAVNGMSKNARNGENANSALLVSVEPSDFEGEDVLSGCYLQRKIERAAFELCGGAVPITTVGSFVFGEKPEITTVKPTVKPRFQFANLEDIFPQFITESLKYGILEFDKKIVGFATKSAIITAPETRSSSPVRILRNDSLQSTTLAGLYPCGEGAGYAGGIVSAAVDGMLVAEQIIDSINYRE